MYFKKNISYVHNIQKMYFNITFLHTKKLRIIRTSIYIYSSGPNTPFLSIKLPYKADSPVETIHCAVFARS